MTKQYNLIHKNVGCNVFQNSTFWPVYARNKTHACQWLSHMNKKKQKTVARLLSMLQHSQL